MDFRISVKLLYPELSISCLLITILLTPASETFEELLVLLTVKQGVPSLLFHLQSLNSSAWDTVK